jgi:hypothetical protein
MLPPFVAALRQKIRNCVTAKSPPCALCASVGTVMEHAMPRLRIGSSAACCLLFLAATATGASAQTATADAPGKPLPLLQIVHQQSKSKIHPGIAAKSVKKTHLKRRIAKRIPVATDDAVMPASQAPTPQQPQLKIFGRRLMPRCPAIWVSAVWQRARHSQRLRCRMSR